MAKAKLMGILNVTDDSFYDQSRYSVFEEAVARGLQIAAEGADLIDIGGESTRPGAPSVPEELELERVIPVIKALCMKTAIPISIDTVKPHVAVAAIAAGASMINDVSGFRDPEMCEVAVSCQVPVCLMHMQKTPSIMQENPCYPQGVVNEVCSWFEIQIIKLIKSGIKEKNIMIDPGIGFGKTIAHNLEIIQNLHKFKAMGFPLLLGVSRKSFMSKILNKPSGQLIHETVAMNAIALLSKVDMIRVHDVKEHRGVIDLLEQFMKHGNAE